MAVPVLAVVLALVLAPAALAEPWDGGLNVTSPAEQTFSQIATELSGRPSQARCWSPQEWAANPFGGTRADAYAQIADGITELGPNVCGPLDAFRLANPKLACQDPIVETYTVRIAKWKWVKRYGKRVRVKKWVRVKRTREIQGEPYFCGFPGDIQVSDAAQTLAHESVHLTGVLDEGIAECHGRQNAKRVLTSLGAPNTDYAYELGRLMLRTYPPGSPYNSPECHDGGTLDLNPSSEVWP